MGVTGVGGGATVILHGPNALLALAIIADGTCLILFEPARKIREILVVQPIDTFLILGLAGLVGGLLMSSRDEVIDGLTTIWASVGGVCSGIDFVNRSSISGGVAAFVLGSGTIAGGVLALRENFNALHQRENLLSLTLGGVGITTMVGGVVFPWEAVLFRRADRMLKTLTEEPVACGWNGWRNSGPGAIL